MNKKGFAISIILYSIVLLLISIFYMLLGILKSRYSVNHSLRDDIMEQMNNHNAADVLKRKINVSSCNPTWVDNMGTTNTTSDDITYLVGTSECINFNYVWYSGKLWRITAIYPDGSLKLVTDNVVATIAWGSSTEYNGSWIYQWLTEDFYDTLINTDNIIKPVTWNYSMSSTATARPETLSPQLTVTAKVGMLNSYEYYVGYKRATTATGFLNIGYYWWTLTPYTDSAIRLVSYTGSLGNNPPTYVRGVRPSIVLKPSINFVGEGTKDNPFKIPTDKASPTYNTSLVSSRTVGEYVRFNNDLYRILEIQGGTTKIIKVDYLLDSNSAAVVKRFASSVVYGKSSNTASDIYWDYYLNNTWYNSIPTTYKNMLTNSTYYIARCTSTVNHKQTICSDANLDSTPIKSCTKYTSSDTDKTYTGKVGISRYGEIFATQPPGGNSVGTLGWLLTAPTTTNVYYISQYSAMTNDPADNLKSVRPIVTLKSTIKITAGNGYISNPFEISS